MWYSVGHNLDSLVDLAWLIGSAVLGSGLSFHRFGSIRISLKAAGSRSSSFSPAGKSLAPNRYATRSVYWRVLRLPGSSDGMDFFVNSYSAPAVLPFQFRRKSAPTRGGEASPPNRFSPWHLAHSCR